MAAAQMAATQTLCCMCRRTPSVCALTVSWHVALGFRAQYPLFPRFRGLCPLQVAFIAGLMYTTVGLLRLGWLTNFLSHTTISGFMSGACIVIALSQVSCPSWVHCSLQSTGSS